jgi:hypothetical protein
MPVRTKALIVAIMAVIACGLGSVQAEAAPMSAAQAAATSPPGLFGGHCVHVSSSVHHRAGTICVYLSRISGKAGGEVTFAAHSGTLAMVSVQTLRITLDNQPFLTVRNLSKTVSGSGIGSINRNWWDEPKGAIRVGARQACMTWTGGDKACTSASWLSSQPVLE